MATIIAQSPFTKFGIRCPFCASDEATVRIDLNSLGACICTGCDEEFYAHDVVDRVAQQLTAWHAVVRWINSAGDAMAAEVDAE